METGVRGKNKVSALAKDLAQKFRGDGTPPTAKKVSLLTHCPLGDLNKILKYDFQTHCTEE